MKTLHCFVPDCIKHSKTPTCCYLSLSQEPNVKQSLNYANNELRVLFYIQSVRVQAYRGVVDI